jgi:hypothetical protein
MAGMNRVRRAISGPVAVAAAAVAGCGVLLVTNPNNPDSWLPRCPFNWLTGLDCPACGSTRMVHALLHGDIVAAWHFNAAMLVAGLPVLAWLWYRWFAADRQKRSAPPLDKRVGLTVLTVAAAWTLLRNLIA